MLVCAAGQQASCFFAMVLPCTAHLANGYDVWHEHHVAHVVFVVSHSVQHGCMPPALYVWRRRLPLCSSSICMGLLQHTGPGWQLEPSHQLKWCLLYVYLLALFIR